MRKKLVIAAIVGTFAVVSIARAFTLNAAFLAGRAMVHISGTGTSPPPPPPSPPPPPPPPPSYTPPAPAAPPVSQTPDYRPFHQPDTKPYGQAGEAPSTPASTTPGGIGFGSERSGSGLVGSGTGQAETPAPSRPASVVNADGREFTAQRVTSGLADELRVFTGRERVNIKISELRSVEFGHKDLNRLEVAVFLADGQEIKGTIYSGTVFEFAAAGGVFTARAEELNAITFGQGNE